MRADSGWCAPAPSRRWSAPSSRSAPDHPARALLAEAGIAAAGDTLVLRRDRQRRRPQPRLHRRPAGERRPAAPARRAPGRDRGAVRRARPARPGDPSRRARRLWRTWPALEAADRRLAQLARARQGTRRRRRRARQGARRGGLPAPRAGRARRARSQGGRGETLAEERALLHESRADRRGARGRAARARRASAAPSARWPGPARSSSDCATRPWAGSTRRGAALERAALETREAIAALEAEARALGSGAAGLERIEERLFALRALGAQARHRGRCLPQLARGVRAAIATLDDGGDAVEGARRAEQPRRARPTSRPPGNSASARRRAAHALDEAVMKELPPLQLEKARFATVLDAARRGGLGRARRPSACASRSRPIPARRRGRSPRSPRAASCRASCWRSRWCWRRPRRCRPWCSTRSIAASAAPPRPRSASGCIASAATCRCWW